MGLPDFQSPLSAKIYILASVFFPTPKSGCVEEEQYGCVFFRESLFLNHH